MLERLRRAFPNVKRFVEKDTKESLEVELREPPDPEAFHNFALMVVEKNGRLKGTIYPTN